MNLQQLYKVISTKAKVLVGLVVLRKYGLNWDVPDTDIQTSTTDFEGLVRSTNYDKGLMASLEDCLVHELYADAKKSTGSTSFVIAIISTKKLDLPYLLRRADEKHVGNTMRLAFNQVLEITSSGKTEVDAKTFLTVRTCFLDLARQYARSQPGFWKFVEERGIGNIGLPIIRKLTEYDVVTTAGKQLGVIG